MGRKQFRESGERLFVGFELPGPRFFGFLDKLHLAEQGDPWLALAQARLDGLGATVAVAQQLLKGGVQRVRGIGVAVIRRSLNATW